MRLFVALDLPPETRARLHDLTGGIPGVRWVPAENYHVTLRFIGELERWRAAEVDDALAGLHAPCFSLSLRGVGAFARAGRVTSLWCGVERSPALDHLQSKIERALHSAGLERERRRFTPHVTLARLDGAPEEKVAGWVQGRNLFRCGPIPVAHFTLFSSHLGKEQAVYHPEAEYDLARPAPPAAFAPAAPL